MFLLREMSEQVHLRNWRPWAKLTVARLVVIKPIPKRRANATQVLKSTQIALKQINNIRQVTVKRKLNLLVLLSYMEMKTITIIHWCTLDIWITAICSSELESREWRSLMVFPVLLRAGWYVRTNDILSTLPELVSLLTLARRASLSYSQILSICTLTSDSS